MQSLWAISRSLLSPVVVVIVLLSLPRAQTADEISRKPTSLSKEKRKLFLASAERSLAKAPQAAGNWSQSNPPVAHAFRGAKPVLSSRSDGGALATQNLSGSDKEQSAHTVNLEWNASSSPSVVGYNIYRGSASGGPYARINSVLDVNTVYADTSVSDGDTYYYVTTSVDSSNQESAYSNEAAAIIP